jgi:lysozyme
MTNIFGPDISFYQDDEETARQIDFEQMKRNGAKFVIVRAGQRYWVDPDFAYNVTEARKAGLPRGTYWFYDSREDPIKQADLYASMLEREGYGELPAFADFEDDYKGAYHGPKFWKMFLDRLRVKFPNQLIGIYTAFYYWKDNIEKLPTVEQEYFRQYVLWIANYGVSTPLVPAPWKEWHFWQYTASGNGKAFGAESTNIDMNYFNGDEDKFRAFFGLTGEPTPEPIDEKSSPFEGVDHLTLHRFGTTVHLLITDLRGKRFQISGGNFGTVTQAAQRYQAQIVTNGDGWAAPKMRIKNVPNSIAVSNGLVKQAKRYDYRPWINVSKENVISFGDVDSVKGLYNAVSGDRWIVIDGKFDTRVSDRRTKNARTAIGVTTTGKLMQLVADGDDSKNIGLSFPEMANVMIEFGCKTAINLDGGGSSALWIKDRIANHPNDDNIFGPPAERSVVNHVMLFIEGGSPSPDPEPIPLPQETLGSLLKNDAVRLKDADLSDHVSQLEVKFPDVFKESK